MPSPSAYCICTESDSCRQYNDIEHFVKLYADTIQDHTTEIPILYHGLLEEAEELTALRMEDSRNATYDRCAPSARNSLRNLRDITERIAQGSELSAADCETALEHLAAARIAISCMRRAMKKQ